MTIPQEFFDIKFEKARVFGYKTDEVDGFVEKAAALTEQLQAENDAMQEKMETLAATLENYREEEDSLKAALIGAQRLADSILKDARAKADAIQREANDRAETIVGGAEKKADALLEEAIQKHDMVLGDIDARLISQKKLLEETKRETANFKSALIEMYRDHLERVLAIPSDVDDLPAEQPEAPAPAEQPAPQQPTEQPAPEPAQPEPAPETAPASHDFISSIDLDALLKSEGIEIGFVEGGDGQVGFELPNEEPGQKPGLAVKKPKKDKYADMRFGEGYNIMKD